MAVANLSDANLDQMHALAASIRDHRAIIDSYQAAIDQNKADQDAHKASLLTDKQTLRNLIAAMTA